MNYWVSLQGHSQDHPTKDTLKPCWEKERKETKSFGWTVIQKATELEVVKIKCIPTVPLPAIPPWILPDATVDKSLLEKKNMDIEYIMNSHTVQTYIFTTVMFSSIQMHQRVCLHPSLPSRGTISPSPYELLPPCPSSAAA